VSVHCRQAASVGYARVGGAGGRGTMGQEVYVLLYRNKWMQVSVEARSIHKKRLQFATNRDLVKRARERRDVDLICTT
jgi:hypothetical protein